MRAEVAVHECVLWEVTDEIINQAVTWASRRIDTSVDRKNMPLRSLVERLDHKIMGDVATLGLKLYLNRCGRNAICYDEIRNDAAQNIDPGWDVLSGSTIHQYEVLKRVGAILCPELVTYSVKSSRIPTRFSLGDCVAKLDFKILRYAPTLAEDLRADFEVQIYFEHETQAPTILDEHSLRELIEAAQSDGPSSKQLAKMIDASRFKQMYLCRYISRDALLCRSGEAELHGEPQFQQMRIGRETKEIWTAKLRWGSPFEAVG